MPYLLALDQGTSSSRAIVFDHQGAKCAVAQREFAQHFPQPGWVEHDADAIWSSILDTARAALAEARLSARDIAAIGITNQRETIVLWDRHTGKPLHRAIVWQDRRTATMLDKLRAAGCERMVRAKTGLFLDPYFSGSKLCWLLDNIPGARAAAKAGRLAAGTIDAWLVYKLTGGKVHITDASNASRTLLMNIHTGAWDPALLSLFKIPASVLPEIGPNSGRLAQTDPTLFGTPIPVAGIVGDQQAALFGQLCTRPGRAKCTYGTGCFLLMFTGTRAIKSRNRLLTTVAWRIGDEPIQYALEGSVFIGGAAIQWLRDGLHLIATAPEVNELAAQVPDAGGVVVVPAFTGLGAPYWDASARGAILGLTRGTTAAHLARATLEAIAFEVGDLVEAIQRDAATPLRDLRVDGGAAASDLLMQMQADQLGVRVVRPANLETTALGAAYMAGLAVGVWPSFRALAAGQRSDRMFSPQMRARERAARRESWRRAVQRAKGWQQE